MGKEEVKKGFVPPAAPRKPSKPAEEKPKPLVEGFVPPPPPQKPPQKPETGNKS